MGAICNEARGDTRIYNCGVLATESTVKVDDDGYTHITSNSSTISGSHYVGGIVGLLDGSARVINCFSYAEIKGGSEVGGIVGHNNVATTSSNLKTMVMNCMFYGDITGGTNKAPIYNGTNIVNKDATGVGNYNYFYGDASYVQNQQIDTYNCALMAETRFLQRFEFFRHLLNSHRELAAWWATGDYTNKDEMAKWVLLPSQIGSSTPYPVLARPGYYPSVVNIDAENATTQTERNKGGLLGTLSVTIQMGNGEQFNAPTDAEIVYPSLTLNITDKDPEHFNFNYAKVQLPYYNDVGTKNYTGNRVVTGWKIVSITGGSPGTFSTGTDATTDANGNITAAPYNFADRNCTAKDLYSTSSRVFNQGAYWDVPEGVTAITIEPYWAKAAYLADANADKVYNTDMGTGYDVPNVGGGAIYTNNTNYSIAGNEQKVYTSLSDARNNLGPNSSHTVYDYALVFVGNYHKHDGVTSDSGSLPYTLMSADFDGDNEPDYSYILRFNGRIKVHPVRVDFLNVPGLGMAQKSTGGKGTYNFGIMNPIGWFETTNTSLFRVTQFEYDYNKDGTVRTAAPLILQGGVMEQWVSGQDNGVNNQTTYFHVGGNVWFKEFHRGTHIDYNHTSAHPPVSVTGGDYDEFYLTGLYKAVTKTDDNAECYINGGNFGIVAGTGMEGIGNATNHTNGNIVWQIQNADIKEFYGGGINAASTVEGNITNVITGGYIKQFCGGPKFGDLNSGRKVITTATDCEFDTFFGAGYGGNSYSTYPPKNVTGTTGDYGTDNWKTFVNNNYKQEYQDKSTANPAYKGVSTEFYYQYLPQSNNTQNVERIFVNFVTFSLATTHNVTSTLTDCTINKNFYGGGSLGKVDGPVTSTLNNCTVKGNIFGAGYSASLPTVEVMNTGGFIKAPYYDSDLGAYFEPTYPETVIYKWEHKATVNSTATAIDKTNHILYTTEDLTTLGTVTGDVTLNIVGDQTQITGDVYGGGALSSSNTDYYKATDPDINKKTTVNLLGGTIRGDVYGGGQGRLAVAAKPAEGSIPAVEAVEAVEAFVGNTQINLNGLTANGTNYSNWGLAKVDAEDPTSPWITTKGCIITTDAEGKKGRIFGCNNLNGTPKGEVTVHVYKTNGASMTETENLDDIDDSKHNYHLLAVYGGGNLAAYMPTNALSTDETVKKTALAHVIIDGCDRTSIETVYGGGNAASTPATKVDVYGTYEIEEVFGGGNGKDALPNGDPNPGANVGFYAYTDDVEGDTDTKENRATNYGYGTGEANVNIYGGRVHRVFGGSNTKGNVRIVAVTMLDNENNTCDFIVDEAYGGGKSAPMDGAANLIMHCIPGLKAAYGGAEEANINGDVKLTITNGNFDRVFGGNNVSGTITGKIEVNIEETGCKPIIIGQLYGGGNQARYDGPENEGPTLNVRSFTSIGDIFGGGYGKTAVVTGNTTVNISVTEGRYSTPSESISNYLNGKLGNRTISFTEYLRDDDTGDFVLDTDGNRTTEQQNIDVFLPTHEDGNIGAINNVYGGGNAAKVDGNTTVNIGTLEYVEITSMTAGTDVSGYYTRSGEGTTESPYEYEAATGTAQEGVTYYKKVTGVDIRGNVYGGGNNAEVTGDANVIIGSPKE